MTSLIAEVAALPWKDIAPWVAIIVSLCWNFTNTLIANRQWQRNQNFVEFRSLKPPIDVALGKLRESKKSLESLKGFGGSAADFTESFKSTNKSMTENYTSLVTAFEACDVSNHWPMNNLAHKYEMQWDNIIAIADGVYGKPLIADKEKTAALVAGNLGALIQEVATEVERTVTAKIKPKQRGLNFLILLVVAALAAAAFGIYYLAHSDAADLKSTTSGTTAFFLPLLSHNASVEMQFLKS